MDDVALSRCFLPALPFYPNSIIQLIIHTHFSLIAVTSEEQVGENQKPRKKAIFFRIVSVKFQKTSLFLYVL